MAGDWIKWVKGLPNRREVRVMSRALKLSPREVACICMEVWGWADDETSDGNIPGATAGDVDSIVNVPGFARAMCAQDVRWLIENDSGLSFPRWDKNNGDSAKKRAMEQRKKKRQRRLGKRKRVPKLSRKCPDVCPDEKGTPLLFSSLPLSLPKSLENESFRTAFEEWLAYKRDDGQTYKPRGLKAMISLAERRVREHGVDAVVGAIEKAIAGGWEGWDHDSSYPKVNGRPGGSRADPRGTLAMVGELLNEIDQKGDA